MAGICFLFKLYIYLKMLYLIQETPTEIRLAMIDDEVKGKLPSQLHGCRVVAGKLETWEKEEKIPARSVDKLQQHGYRFISETAYKEYRSKAAELVLPKTKKTSGKAYSLVPWETIHAQFAPAFLNDVDEYLQDPVYRQFCLYSGDTVINGNVVINFSELDTTAQTETRNIVVDGDLTINGDLDGGYDIASLPQFVYVKGNLKAGNLLLSGWLDVVVEGNAIIENTVLGYEGEPGGRLLVKGDLQATNLLNGGMYTLDVKGDIRGNWYNFGDQDSTGKNKAVHIPGSFTQQENVNAYPLREIVVPYSQSLKEYRFHFEQACALLRKGETIFK